MFFRDSPLTLIFLLCGLWLSQKRKCSDGQFFLCFKTRVKKWMFWIKLWTKLTLNVKLMNQQSPKSKIFGKQYLITAFCNAFLRRILKTFCIPTSKELSTVTFLSAVILHSPLSFFPKIICFKRYKNICNHTTFLWYSWRKKIAEVEASLKKVRNAFSLLLWHKNLSGCIHSLCFDSQAARKCVWERVSGWHIFCKQEGKQSHQIQLFTNRRRRVFSSIHDQHGKQITYLSFLTLFLSCSSTSTHKHTQTLFPYKTNTQLRFSEDMIVLLANKLTTTKIE